MKQDRSSLGERQAAPLTEAEAVEMVAAARVPPGGSINDVLMRRVTEMQAQGRALTREAQTVLEKYMK